MVGVLSRGRRKRSRQWFLARLTTARRAYGVGSPRIRRHLRATCSSAVCTTSSAWPRSPVSRYAVRSNPGDASRTNSSKSPPGTSIRTPVNTPPRSKGLHSTVHGLYLQPPNEPSTHHADPGVGRASGLRVATHTPPGFSTASHVQFRDQVAAHIEGGAARLTEAWVSIMRCETN